MFEKINDDHNNARIFFVLFLQYDNATPMEIWRLIHLLDDSKLRSDDLRQFQLILYRIPWRKEPKVLTGTEGRGVSRIV